MSSNSNHPFTRLISSAMPYKLAIPSMSLGRCAAGHSFINKMDAAKKHGYQGIELAFEDLVGVARELSGEALMPEGPSYNLQLATAAHINAICKARGLEIICLQPLAQYDGLIDHEEHARRLEQVDFWFQLAKVLETDLIQVPASYLPEHLVTEEAELIINDLIEIADMGLRQNPPIRFAYESLCWSTRVSSWEMCWEIVQLVNRPNFGMVLDTFNIAGLVYADPTVASGLAFQAEFNMRQSISRLVESINVKKVFYVQIVDAERLDEPLVPGHPFYNPEQRPRMSWSRNCRLFYGETDRGAYLPITDIAWAIFHGIGYEGWVSLELFNRRMEDKDPAVPEELAKRGAVSWAKLQKDMGLETGKVRAIVTRVVASL
ncbi:hypothetical protein VTJ49DRAFT_3579 [Mycothermus thermophilus]|uniref:Xylose isomerase-like TIM barrel domain-containing protein n=1 Tax=Humicola insolens TaxID=85995 RepID=A0ABR3V947_HUMIN